MSTSSVSSSPRRSWYEEQAAMAHAEKEANALLVQAISTHGVLPVLSPWKHHRSASTGSEYSGRNQAILEAQRLAAGFEETQWVTKSTFTRAGGSLKVSDDHAVEIFGARQRYKEVDKKDEAGVVVLNPETGAPDTERVYSGPMRPFAMSVFNVEQVKGYEPPTHPLTPEAKRLPAAVSAIWRELAMPKPTIVAGAAMSYDMATDTLVMPPREAVKDHRQSTLAAFELSRHMALACGHPKRLNIPAFVDPARFDAERPQIELATAAAAAIYMRTHCEKWDPEMMERSGIAEIRNIAGNLKKLDMMAGLRQAQLIYRYMAYGPKSPATAPGAAS